MTGGRVGRSTIIVSTCLLVVLTWSIGKVLQISQLLTISLPLATNPESELAVEEAGGKHFYTTLNYDLANYESYGFFDDIATHEWKLLRERVKDVYPNVMGGNPDALRLRRIPANDFYQEHYEPDFACRHERRIGQLGDGGKWVCDPHRLKNRSDCLVYSVGSEGDASFERAVKKEIGEHCEIHTFDMGPYRDQVESSGAQFHQWGIAAKSTTSGQSYTGPGLAQGSGNFKTLQQTIQELNHTGRIIDLFKIDCEYCEWEVFPAFFESGVHLQQILIELHAFRKPLPMPQTIDFFEAMYQNGYVIFHKEVNIKHWVGEAIEYAFLKLRPEESNINDVAAFSNQTGLKETEGATYP